MLRYFSRPLMADERKYTFRSCSDIEVRSGLIGYARIDMPTTYADANKKWYTVSDRLNDSEFRRNFKEVISRISSHFSSREQLRVYYNTHLTLTFTDRKSSYVGMRVLTDKYIYLLRVKPSGDTDNLFIFCYSEERLSRHIQNATRGIRFVNKDNHELFMIRDGDCITVTPSRLDMPIVCRYIDPFNVWICARRWEIKRFVEYVENAGRTISSIRCSGAVGLSPAPYHFSDRKHIDFYVARYYNKLNKRKENMIWRQ